MPLKDSELIGKAMAGKALVLALAVLALLPSVSAQAALMNFSVSERVFLNDIVSARVRLWSNITNMSLDGQDCSVVAYDNITMRVVKWWDTQCRQGEPYLDDLGNWATFTNCPISDTNGNYFFTGRVTEEDGFQTGGFYVLELNCNRNSVRGVFYVDVPKPTDVMKWFEFIRRYYGIIALWFMALVFAVAFILLGLKYVGGG